MSAAAKRRRYLLYYDIHSWTGIIGGLLFFICCYTGVIALFEHELTQWEDPITRVEPAGEAMSVDALFERALEVGPPLEESVFVELPSPWQSAFRARFILEEENHNVALDPYTGEEIAIQQTTAFEFLTHLHTDLHLPRPWGRYLVGLIGIFMLMSIFAGVMAHPKIFKEMFLFRWRRSLRLSFSDLHKQLGVWSLVFSIVLAFTGAIIGLLGLFAPVMVLSAFGGDVDKAVVAYSGPPSGATGVSAPMRSFDDLIAGLEAANPGHTVHSLFIQHYGDEGADVGLNLSPDTQSSLLTGSSHRFNLATGEPIHVASFAEQGAGRRIFGTMQPLHYGQFGGMGLRVVYLVMGIAMSLSIVTGSMVWLERRSDRRSTRSDRPRYHWLNRLTLGICMGLVLASVLAIMAGRLWPAAIEPMFWSSWLAAIGAAYFVTDSFQGTRLGLMASAAILLATALADLALSEALPAPVVSTDLTMIAIALLTFAAARLIPRRRPSDWRRRRQTAGPAVSETVSP